MSIKSSYDFKTAKQLYRERDRLKFDHQVQRNPVWKEDRQSLFIHSLLDGYPYPPVYSVEDQDGNLWFLDGKQRLTSVFDYLDDKYPLHHKTPKVNGNKVAGLKFSELPDELRELIEGANFQIYQFRDVSEEQVREIFLRLNNNVPLTKYEKARVIASDEILLIIEEVRKSKFFKEIVNLSKIQRTKFADEEVILQSIMLLENDKKALDISSRAIKRGLETMKDVGVSKSVIDELRRVNDYLSEAFTSNVTNLRKMHISSLFITAANALEREIPASVFGEWAISFLKNYQNSPLYQYALLRGSLRKVDVEQRLTIMRSDFEGFLNRSKLFAMA
jgi:hypothetical protein